MTQARPTAQLPGRELLILTMYWFGISAMWGGYEIFGQHQVEVFTGVDTRGTTLGVIELAAAMVAIVVQPTVGTLSDYTRSRWGRRKPYIIVGATLDLVLLVGIATSQSLLALTAFLLLLQASSNLAQGPYQGYVPDLVPEPQVGVASGLMGLLRVLGLIAGAALVSTGAATGNYALPLIAVGVVELALAGATVVLVREGPPPRPRGDRSWSDIAREAWGLDVLRERSFLWLTMTRLLFLMGPAVFVNLSLFYVRDSLGQSGGSLAQWLTIGTATLAVGSGLATFPAARLSDRVGRKPIIWIAAAAMTAGIVVVALAPSPIEAIAGLLLLGAGSGAWLAVDWALMTETIPLAASGRYMGLANVANSISGPLAVLVGGVVLDVVTRRAGLDAGPRAAILTGILFIAAGCLTLLRVHPRRVPPSASPAPVT